jgi:membrane protease YdiL (CAAX protease family)
VQDAAVFPSVTHTVFVRQGEDAVPALPGLLPGLTASTEVARAHDGPFAPLALALHDDADLREAFARGLELPLTAAYARARLWLLIGLVPLLMLAELDRELWRAGIERAGPRLGTDLFLVAIAALDLARRLPRHPRATAVLLFAGAARYALFVARPCAHGVHPTIYLAPIVAATAGVLLLARAPTPQRVADAILERLGISAAEADRVRVRARPTRAYLGAALICAMGLPLVLAATRAMGPWISGAFFIAYAAIVPFAVERRFEQLARRRVLWGDVLPAAAVAFALTTGLTNGAHYGFDAGIHTARCIAPVAFGEPARAVLDAEGHDVAKNIARARESAPFFVMTVVVVPMCEERVFRGLLQRVLARRLGDARGITLAALAFGLAHLGVYKVAVYQTVLMGVGFGTAYAAGGYPAAVLAHAAWNLLLLL